MVIKEGYKQTEIGVIPNDWEVKSFKDVSYMKGRIGWQGLNQTEFTMNSNEPFLITGMNFKNGAIRWNEVYHISEDRFEIAKDIQLKDDDVLMTKDGTIGKLLYVENIPYPHKASLNSHLLVFRPLKNLYNPKYLYYNLLSPYFFKHIELTKSGTTFFGISQTSVGEYNIILPPLAEQTAIANALSDADGLITGLEKLIVKKRNIKQGAMQQLLQPKDGWEVKKLGELGKVYGGLSGKSKIDFHEGKFPYIPFMNIMSNSVINSTYLDYVNIKNGEFQNQALRGDLFFNGSSETPEEVGMCSALLEDIPNLYLNSFCFGYRLYKEHNADSLYLSYFFRSDEGRNLFYAMAQGATRYNLSKGNFLKLEIKLPKPEEQTRIASILSDMDAELSALEQKLEKYKKVKLGMMQELLTGKTRLV